MGTKDLKTVADVYNCTLQISTKYKGRVLMKESVDIREKYPTKDEILNIVKIQRSRSMDMLDVLEEVGVLFEDNNE